MRGRRRNLGLVVLVPLGLSAGAALGPGCSAGGVVGAGGSGNASSSTSSSVSSSSGDGGGIFIPDAGGDVATDVPVACTTACGPMELCDDFHTGLDDDCDGQADEDCSCSAGQVHSCFLGDPAYRDADGCFEGTEKCSENGKWGPCQGGVHATAEQKCFINDKIGCHAISNPPFFTTDLKEGTGDFSDDAVFGTETWTVACPAGVNACPAVGGTNPPDDFKPLQSGEYTVTYTKGLANGMTASCTYPLFVGAPGLRVELSWEHDLGGKGVDIDLHLHQPNDTQPWDTAGGAPQDCSFANCDIKDFSDQLPTIPKWFPDNGQAPEPVSWWKDPVFEKNNCYFAPRGVGLKWQLQGQGCHNPRLDLDNYQCDSTITDPDSLDFCAPENINVDYPPKDQWFRIGVHYYSNNMKTYDVHPVVRVFCDGALTAELGEKGYYDPETAVTFASSDGADLPVGNRFWLVGDVLFPKQKGECATRGCVVKPLYTDQAKRTPVLTYDEVAKMNFGPPYPPAP
jgi:hypothetical protein